MKTVFLILYFWHSATLEKTGYHYWTLSQTGGPVFELKEMPNLTTCEVVGAKAKEIVDKQMPTNGKFLTYGCVAVDTAKISK